MSTALPLIPLAAAMGDDTATTQILTLAISLAAGGFLMVIAKRIGVPGIVLLLAGGVLLGPEVAGVVQPASLGSLLTVLVSLSVGLILFEGGLTLNVDGYRNASKVIRNVLTIGVAVTWFGTALIIWAVFQVEPLFALLAGSLVIVTGPTVIQPLLKRIRVKSNLHHILHWEGVLVDPIGVFLAILAFEWVVGGQGDTALLNLGTRIVGGLLIGFIGGELIAWLLRRRWVPEDMTNVFMVASAVLIFGLTEWLILEGGLLSVTVAGLIVGSRQPPALRGIVEFKTVLTEILIGFVFILLVARLELMQFMEFGWRGALVVALVMLAVRPAMIWASAIGTDLGFRDKLFLGWVAPRGIVAASMASLFTLSLAEQGRFAQPQFIETFVYSVICATVILQGFTAGPLARWLGLKQPEPQGWLIIGAHPVARAIAQFLIRFREVPVVLLDGNRRAVVEAQNEGLTAIFGDAREADTLSERDELRPLGRLLALTDNEDLNELLCKKWVPTFGQTHVYRWASGAATDESATGTVLWSWMPKPSMLSSEILLGEAALLELSGSKTDAPGLHLAALMTAHKDEVLLDPRPDSQLSDGAAEPHTLFLQREADYLLQALASQLIFRAYPVDKEELFYIIAQRIAENDPQISVDSIHRQVMERENAAPTTLGHGIAMPHAKIEGLSQTVCAIAQLPDGLPFYPEDEEPVRLVFLLLSPAGEPEMHLAVMGEIARLCAETRIREQMIEAPELPHILETIRLYRRLHTPFADARG